MDGVLECLGFGWLTDVFVADALLGDIFMTYWNWQYGLSVQLSVFALASSALLLHCQLFTGAHTDINLVYSQRPDRGQFSRSHGSYLAVLRRCVDVA